MMTDRTTSAMPQKRDLDRAISDSCIEIIREPLTHFSEADCQQLVAEKLRTIPILQNLHETGVSRGKDSKGHYKSTLLHREYGGGGRTRIDIVVLRPSDVREIDSTNLTRKGKYIEPLFAIELGTEKSSDTAAHLASDLRKLQRGVVSGGCGYIIHIFRDTTQSRTGTASRARTEAKLRKNFKDAFTLARTCADPKIRILAILLRTGRSQTRMTGKCEIFMQDRWVKVNVSRKHDLRKAILEQLK